MSDNKERKLWIDCIKVFSTFLIVMQHSIAYEWVKLIDTPEGTWRMINFVFMLSKAGVPIFIMCSGIGMLRKEKSIKEIFFKNMIGIIKIYVCWMLLYGICDVYSLFCDNLATFRTVINAMIKNVIFGEYHTWFVMTLLALYLITPFLYLIVQSKTMTQYFLFLSFVFTIVLPYAERYEFLSRFYKVITDANMKFVVGYSLYFVLGYYLARIRLTKKRKGAIIIGFAFCSMLAYLLSSSKALYYGAECQNVFTEFSILGFGICVGMLLIFRMIFEDNKLCVEKREQEKKMHKFITDMSYCGIGIYLLHPIFLGFIENLTGWKCLIGGFVLWVFTVVIVKIISILPIGKYFLGAKKL